MRAIEDALTGIIYRDDSQIIAVTAHKIYNESPGVTIKITCPGGNPNVIENHFQRIAPHEELRDGAGEDAAPVF